MNILLLEDADDDALLVVASLAGSEFQPDVRRIESAVELRAALAERIWDVIIALPGFDAFNALEIVRAQDPDLPFIIVSGTISEFDAVEAMRSGANDYLRKDRLARLAPAIERELAQASARRLQREREGQISYLAHYDEGTGLPNRATLLARIEALRDAAAHTHGALFVAAIHIDQLDAVAETLGHDHRDPLLREVAARIMGIAPRADLIARIGDSRLALIALVDADQAEERMFARIQANSRQRFSREGHTLSFSLIAGFVIGEDSTLHADELLRRAELALHAARDARTAAAPYTIELERSAAARLLLLADLERALEQDRLTLAFQPQVDLANLQVTGFEALLRWEHAAHGAVPPDTFIPIAEQTGLITDLTRWVINRALSEMAEWRKHGIEMPVSVNLSARDLTEGEFPSFVASMLKAWDIPPSSLTLEITESAVMEDRDRASACLRELDQLGVRLSLDDFGTGHSSLAYLRDLPVRELKIDRLFLASARTSQRDRLILGAITRLGRDLGLDLVAEGVEDSETITLLRSLGGAISAQGYYFAAPMAASDVPEWLVRRPFADAA